MLKYYKPSSPGQRGLVLVNRSSLWKGKPVKSLTKGLTKTGGRNNKGRVTMRHQGGGHKRAYRFVDFKRDKIGKATVIRLEYDPNRTAFIALIEYEDGLQSYILAPQRLSVGDVIESGEKTDVKPGNTMPIRNIPVGTLIHNVEMKKGKGGQIARAAGGYVQLAGHDGNYAILKLGSGEQRVVHSECKASIGAVSNADHMNISLAKAGRNRWLNRRPTVRGAAMNPVDHPHGGGEGKTSGGRHPVSPWGQSAKGKKTRKNKETQKYILRSRNKQRKR